MMKMEYLTGKSGKIIKMNNFVDVLGSDISNIKIGYDFLKEEELAYLLSTIKIAESRFKEDKLHFAIDKYLNDHERQPLHEFAMKINDRIIKFATKTYDKKFIQHMGNWAINVHRVNSFTDAHTDIIERSPGPQKPGFAEPVYTNWIDAWDGYLACNLYLNDDYNGGQVYFKDRQYIFKPKANSIVCWPGNKNFIHGITKTTKTNRYVYGYFIKFADYDKYNQ
jgi:hypothetical protein